MKVHAKLSTTIDEANDSMVYAIEVTGESAWGEVHETIKFVSASKDLTMHVEHHLGTYLMHYEVLFIIARVMSAFEAQDSWSNFEMDIECI